MKGQSEANWGREKRRLMGVTEEVGLAVHQRYGLWICQPGARHGRWLQLALMEVWRSRWEMAGGSIKSAAGFRTAEWEGSQLRQRDGWPGPEMGSLILSRAEGTLGRGRLEFRGWLFPFGRTLSLSKSAISKARLSRQGIKMPQQPIKIFPDDLSVNATGRFQSIQKKYFPKNHTACAGHDLREGDKMVCKKYLDPCSCGATVQWKRQIWITGAYK